MIQDRFTVAILTVTSGCGLIAAGIGLTLLADGNVAGFGVSLLGILIVAVSVIGMTREPS